ncbi:MAG: glycosyltransferase family 2 protein [Chloroflexi bacterium]|nr:glycosyltransferase family 2 protein [Chloroflexota bacterium]
MQSQIENHKSKISIIIPVHNEEASMPKLVDGLCAWKERAEIILVDDGSTDRSAEIAQRAGFRVMRHRTNKGYGAALKTGIRAASGDIIVMMDADSEHNAAQISKLLDNFGDNDMVVGARAKGSNFPLLRRPGKWLLSQVANYLAQTDIPDLNSGFRAFRKDVAKLFLHILPNGFSFTTTLTLALFKEGYNIAYIPITTAPRVGTSTVNPVKDGLNTLMLIVRIIALFDPLRVFAPTSAILFFIGIGYWILDVVLRQRLNIPSGAIVVILASIIIFMFGILADQVSAIRREKYE